MNKELNCLLTRVSDYMENKQDVNDNGDPNEEMNFVMEIEEHISPSLPKPVQPEPTQLFLLKSYIRMTQGNINMLIKTDKQMAKYFQEDLDSLQRDTGITDEMLYAKEGE